MTLKITPNVENLEILNTFFLNPVKNLKISESKNVYPLIKNITPGIERNFQVR